MKKIELLSLLAALGALSACGGTKTEPMSSDVRSRPPASQGFTEDDGSDMFDPPDTCECDAGECSLDAGTAPDAGAPDSGTSGPDAGAPDAGSSGSDAGAPDAGTSGPDAGTAPLDAGTSGWPDDGGISMRWMDRTAFDDADAFPSGPFSSPTMFAVGPECQATDTCTAPEATDGGVVGRALCYAAWYAGNQLCETAGPPEVIAATICPTICQWKFPKDDFWSRCKRRACEPICRRQVVETLRDKCHELNDYLYDQCMAQLTP